ncbi:MAG: lipoate protein ligase C-terminal domain-containing protein [Candidatus Jordarchaeales archaeon]|nr:hypothetical protein [Candidatus Jordarchaeia archaeon]
MTGNARLKVPGGKMIEAEVELEGKLIRYVRITGDFYFHPEEELEELEETLKGAPIHALYELVEKFLKEKKVTLVGIDAKDIVKVILNAAGQRD